LATVNNELNAKVLDLTRINNDMNNLLAGSGIATVFVDLKLRILRFTPSASQIINLISGDVGRPVAHIVSNLENYQNLISDTQEVLDTLIPKTLEVKTKSGMWFSMIIRPYRTIENVIEGVVITFIDVSERKFFEEALRTFTKQGCMAVNNGQDAIIVQKLDGQTIAWNQAAVKIYGWSESEACVMNIQKRLPENLRPGALTKLIEFSQATILESFKTQRLCKDGTILEAWITASPLLTETGEFYAIATTERIKGSADGQK
jgi:two-component system CheB/CheR fusion protein